jgi:hypothetical protein
MLVLSGEATNTNFIVFGLTRPGLESTIYRTRGEHANHYATDAVLLLNVMCLVEKYEDKLYSIYCDPTGDRTRENINPYFNWQ